MLCTLDVSVTVKQVLYYSKICALVSIKVTFTRCLNLKEMVLKVKEIHGSCLTNKLDVITFI